MLEHARWRWIRDDGADGARFYVTIVLCLALAVRVAVVAASRHYHPINDALDYHQLAVSLAHGRGYGHSLTSQHAGPTAYRPPLYPVFLAAIYRIVGDSITAARVVQAALGTVTVALVGLLSWRIFGARVGWISLLVAAVYPPLIVIGSSLVSEALFIPLEVAALIVAIQAPKSRHRVAMSLTSGALIGLALLTRETAVALLPGVALLVSGAPYRARRAFRQLTVVALAASVVVAPWSARNTRAFRTFVPLSTNTGTIVAGTYNHTAEFGPNVCPHSIREMCGHDFWVYPLNDPHMASVYLAHQPNGEDAVDRAWIKAGLGYAASHPTYVPGVIWWNMVRLVDGQGLEHDQEAWLSLGTSRKLGALDFVGFVLFAPFALIGCFSRQISRAPVGLWLVAGCIVIASAITEGLSRFRAPLEPIVIMLISLGVIAVLETVGRHRRDSDVSPSHSGPLE